MRRTSSPALPLLLIAALFALPGVFPPEPAAAAPAAPLRVGVVYSAISAGETVNRNSGVYATRVSRTLTLLQGEPGISAEQIDDAALRDIARLRQFDAIVLPRTTASDEAQRVAIRQYASEGGGVVTIFSPSRYDYRPGTSSPYAGNPNSYRTPYWPFNFYWGFSAKSYMSQAFEYGELSEMIGTRFANDPLFYSNYQLVGNSPSAHPILQMTAADLGTSNISFTDNSNPIGQYNETVWPIRNAPLTTLLNYSGETVAGGGGLENHDYGYGSPTHMAGWAMPYYYGKVVSYGFQLYDLLAQPAAARMLVNSVKWAGTRDGYGFIQKSPDVSVAAWYTRGQIWANAAVSNSGKIQLRGQLKVEYFRPGATTPFDSCYIKDPQGWIPVSPGEGYSDTAGKKPSVAATKGRWVVRVSYRYYDFFRGGWVVVRRDGYLDANGSAMTWRGQSGLVGPTSAKPAPAGSTELSGGDRYATAAAISRAGWPSGVTTSGAVVLTSGVKFPDALAAAPLAGKVNAPILLAGASSVPGPTSAELDRLYASAPSPAKLYIVGAMPRAVIDQAKAVIARAGGGNRVVETAYFAGSDRYDTARLVAQEVGTSSATGFADTVFVATGYNYADALSAAPIAARLGVPILFVHSGVPGPTLNAMSALGVKHAIILGSPNAVSDAVERQLESAGYRTGADPRLAGTTRFDTCVRILDFAKSQAGFSDSALFVATGTNFPDALALAPLAGGRQNPVLLLNGSDIGYSSAGAAYLLGKRGTQPPVTFVGSPAAVSNHVRGQIGVALGP